MITTSRFATLRWVCLVPAALIASCITSVVLHLGNLSDSYMKGVNPDSLEMRVFDPFIRNVAMGVAFVYVGVLVAPSHKKQITLLLMATGALVGIASAIVVAAQRNYWGVLGAASLVFGVGLGTYFVAKRHRKHEP